MPSGLDATAETTIHTPLTATSAARYGVNQPQKLVKDEL
jgi:hypothetical protein